MINSSSPDAEVDLDRLSSWFDVSLSLIGSGDINEQNQPLNKAIDSWKSRVGILTCTRDGLEIWSRGNTGACKKFAQENRLSELTADAPNVQIFGDGLIMVSSSGDTIRLVYSDHATILNVLGEIAPDISLSPAELHLLMQMLSGKSLRESAVIDDVSYETKRSQFKSLAARTGFRTQNEVIRQSLLALSVHALDSAGNSSSDKSDKLDADQNFLNLYYPGIFRLHKISTSQKHLLRVIEAGPVSGAPIVFAHSQTLPPPSQFKSNWLHKNNIRLIIPLRPGLLDEKAERAGIDDHLEHSTSDLAETINLFCRGKARLIAQSTGAAYAVHLARRFPNIVSQITIAAAAYLGKHDNRSIDGLVRGLKQLALHSNFLTEKVYDHHLSKMSSKAGFQTIIQSAYGNSAPDMKIFQDIFAAPLGHSWIYESYRLSRGSVVSDVLMPGMDVWKDVENIRTPTLFLHGASDPVNVLTDAGEIHKRFQSSDFVELPDDGQSIFLNRFEELVARSPQEWLNERDTDHH